MDGIINLYKPAGVTSHNMVAKIRRLYGVKKVGHAGTLDPMATGVLPIMIGTATKLSEMLTDHDKRYRAALKLGMTTDTQDITGKVIYECKEVPSMNDVISIVKTFKGEIKQIPPMYSAIKVGGKKLYELAREGREIDRAERVVNIYSVEVTPSESSDIYFLDVHCSKGTYIRTLCADIGEKSGCGGVMLSLERTNCGDFDVKSSVTPDVLETAVKSGGREAFDEYILPVEAYLLERYGKKIILDGHSLKLAENGAAVILDGYDCVDNFSSGDCVLMYGRGNKFFALGKIFTSDSAAYGVKAEKFFL